MTLTYVWILVSMSCHTAYLSLTHLHFRQKHSSWVVKAILAQIFEHKAVDNFLLQTAVHFFMTGSFPWSFSMQLRDHIIPQLRLWVRTKGQTIT